jgi:hypothetical protein
MNKRHIHLIFVLLLLSGCTSTLYFTLDDRYINDKYKFEDIIKEENLISDSNKVYNIAKIIGDINEDGNLKEQYGNWFSYYYLPSNSNYEGFIRVDDESVDEYLIGYDQYNNENIILVARDYGDGADFEIVYSTYYNNTIYSTKIIEHFLIDETMDTILINLPPTSDTIFENIIFYLKQQVYH